MVTGEHRGADGTVTVKNIVVHSKIKFTIVHNKRFYLFILNMTQHHDTMPTLDATGLLVLFGFVAPRHIQNIKL